jgi:hypothetical protein
MFRDEEDRGLYLFHYTRLSTAIESILPELKLRFSRFSNMRDPRETHWAFSASLWGDIPDVDEKFWGIQSRLEELKSSVRLLSFTEDDSRDRRPPDEVFGRGFSHPRLWEQYAGNHAGVCLVLDKAALQEAVKGSTAAHGVLEQGPVAYRDRPITIEASGVDLREVSERGHDDVLNEHLDRHVRELFFTKLEDWASEVEYRFLTRWEAAEELHVDVRPALKGVIAGHAVSREYAPSLEALCEPHEIGVFKITWQNGLPIPLRFKSRARAEGQTTVSLEGIAFKAGPEPPQAEEPQQ